MVREDKGNVVPLTFWNLVKHADGVPTNTSAPSRVEKAQSLDELKRACEATKNPLLSAMPFSFDPKTLKPWWKTLTPPEELPELILAQRKDFYVLVRHFPGDWIAIAREGEYASPANDWEPILSKGSLLDEVFPVAEKYIRERDPSFKADIDDFITKRQRDILEALDKHKSESQTDLETVRQECGLFAPAVFIRDWEILRDRGFVIERPTNQSNKTVTGMGRITATGEEVLKEIRST